MDKEVTESFALAASLLLMSLFLTLYASMARMSTELVYANEAKQSKVELLGEEADLYKFINKPVTDNPVITHNINSSNIDYSAALTQEAIDNSNNKLMTGSSVIDFIVNNKNKYKYVIQKNRGNINYYKIEANSLDYNNAITNSLHAMQVNDLSNASTKQSFIASSALWTQTYISDYLFGEHVYDMYVPYVAIEDTSLEAGAAPGLRKDVITTDLDYIGTHKDLVTIYFFDVKERGIEDVKR